MTGPPEFLSLETVYDLHEDSIARFGGSQGVRDPGLVSSALASAENTYWYGSGDHFAIAAAYAYHLAESQAFLDGNKRTGAAAALVFLAGNGFDPAQDDGRLYRTLIAIAEKKAGKTELAAVLKSLSSGAQNAV
jgi:death-on-curing protein